MKLSGLSTFAREIEVIVATTKLKAPFPYFGGKSRIAPAVWECIGDVKNYVEPFAGSAAMLLARPDTHSGGVETINDKSGFVSNFWRAVQHDPEAVAHHADWPVNENDLHARHAWLVSEGAGIVSRLEGDPDFYDTRIAGWWVWGACAYIGSGWCSGNRPWHAVDGVLVNDHDGSQGVRRQLPALGGAGKGINRKLPALGNAGQGIRRKIPHLGAGQGINRQLPHLGDAGRGINRKLPQLSGGGRERTAYIVDQMQALADRLRDVRVASGDWGRVVTDSVTTRHGVTGVFLDPPYGIGDWTGGGIYLHEDTSVSERVRAWAIEHGDDPRFRIALCGYAGEHSMPEGWTSMAWQANGGYARSDRARGNAKSETVWLSAHCFKQGLEVDPQLKMLGVA